ncbi:MAG: TldD/PmbA family protein [Promethearchaeota archaeon]
MNLENIDEFKVFNDGLREKFHALAKNNIEYWDLRCELNRGTILDFTNQKSKEISSLEILECGIRAFVRGGWGFTVIKDLSKESLINAFEKTIKMAQLSERLTPNKFSLIKRDPLIKEFELRARKPLKDVDIEDKIELVKVHEATSSGYSPLVKNTRTYYMDREEFTLFQDSNGSDIKQYVSLLRLFNIVHAQKNGIIQKATNSVGGLGGFEIFSTDQAQKLSSKTAREALDLLDAKSPPGGTFDIIMDPKLAGVMIHEAFGHACEADAILNDQSLLKGCLGKKVADDSVNIIDDPTMGKGKLFHIPHELFGSYFVDEEGILAQKTYLIKNGILVNYLHDIETASRMNLPPNGHGRAASTSDRPLVRMGITLLEPQDWTLEEMIEDVKEGLFCKDFQYGYTDPITGNFQFKCKLSHAIKNGETRELMRDVSLSGMILEILNKIGGIGSKEEMGFSDGVCGKQGQGVRVCDGGPPVLIRNVTVGGLN